MATKTFSLEEANDVLVEIRPMIEELLRRRTRVVNGRKDVTAILENPFLDMGGAAASELVLDFAAIERLAQRVRSYGCILKDLNTGLVDFLSVRDGREVYLCWRYGESQISHYHELHTGFSGRRPI